MSARLLTVIGDNRYRKLADFNFPNELSTVSYDDYITNLHSAYGRKFRNESRIRFQSIEQHERQSVDEFFPVLCQSFIDCGFEYQLDNRLNDKFVVGLSSN